MGGYKAKDIFRKIIKNRSYHAGMPDVPRGTRALRAKEGDGRGPLKAKSRKRPSRGYGEQAAEDAEDGVECGVAHFALRYQGEGLEREGGEGGEAAAHAGLPKEGPARGQPPPARPSGDEADEHRSQQVGDQSEQGELPPEGQQAEPPAAYGPRAPPVPTARRLVMDIGALLPFEMVCASPGGPGVPPLRIKAKRPGTGGSWTRPYGENGIGTLVQQS